MDLKQFLKKHKLTKRAFARNVQISRYSIHKYVEGDKPARTQAWKIFNYTDGEIDFKDLGYSAPPSRPVKET